MDTELMNNQITGLIEAGKKLREKEALFLKAQGLDEEITKAQADIEVDEEAAEDLKEELKGLKSEKADAMSATAEGLAMKMGEILPEGNAVFRVDEGGVFLGWDKTPYHGLSGGQKTIFDAALTNALKADLLIIEAAELDRKHLERSMERLKDHPAQVIVNTCHVPETIPENFTVVTL